MCMMGHLVMMNGSDTVDAHVESDIGNDEQQTTILSRRMKYLDNKLVKFTFIIGGLGCFCGFLKFIFGEIMLLSDMMSTLLGLWFGLFIRVETGKAKLWIRAIICALLILLFYIISASRELHTVYQFYSGLMVLFVAVGFLVPIDNVFFKGFIFPIVEWVDSRTWIKVVLAVPTVLIFLEVIGGIIWWTEWKLEWKLMWCELVFLAVQPVTVMVFMTLFRLVSRKCRNAPIDATEAD